MASRLIFEAAGEGNAGAWIAVVEDERLADLIDAREAPDRLGDALLAARVTRIDRHLDAAFLDVGLPEPVFLAGKDARHAKGVERRVAAHKLLAEGERLIVQGLRDAFADKGARVTTDVSLDGVALRFRPNWPEPMPTMRARGGLKARLADLARALFPGEGFVLRPLALELPEEALLAEAEVLRRRWTEARTLAAKAKPGRLNQGLPVLERQVWALLEAGVESVEAADEGLLARLRRLLERLPEHLRPDLIRLEAPRGEAGGAFEITGVAEEVERCTAREVALQGGGRIILEQTAACVAIDVDGGGRDAIGVNLEAAAEIALQARLRNLGGTIVIDFVDLPTKPQRQQLEQALKSAFKNDPVPVQIYPMSPLGIVQLSRAKRGRAPLQAATGPCPTCGGSGLSARNEG